MKRLLIPGTVLVLAILAAGCTGIPWRQQTTDLGKLILNPNQIDRVVIFDGPAENRIGTLGPADITELMKMVGGIPVTRLSEQQDIDYMPSRILEDHLTIRFYTMADYNERLQGILIIWPDGYLYAVEMESMASGQRSTSYLSRPTHAGIYTWLLDQAAQDTQVKAASETAAAGDRPQAAGSSMVFIL